MLTLRPLLTILFATSLATLPTPAVGSDAPGVVELPVIRTLSSVIGDDSLKSLSGKEFELYQYGKDAPHRFLVQGGLHGNEALASHFVVWLARRYARGESMLNLLPKEKVAIDFLPYANPDGTTGDSRYNGRGVNLNRNFGILWGLTRENPGETSFSEPETKAIKKLFQKRKYAAAVDVHGYVNWIVAPSTPAELAERGIKPSRKRVAAYDTWLSALKQEMPLLSGYQLKTAGKLGDGGAFEDWAFWSEGTFAYCLELESFQRFVKSYRRDFNDITKDPEVRSVDLFTRYEAFVYRMFDHALKAREAADDPAQLAGP